MQGGTEADLLHQQLGHGQPALQLCIGGLEAPQFSALGRHLADQLSVLLPLILEQRPCLLQRLLQGTVVTRTEGESLWWSGREEGEDGWVEEGWVGGGGVAGWDGVGEVWEN